MAIASIDSNLPADATFLKNVTNLLDKQKQDEEKNLLIALYDQWKQYGEIRDKELLVLIGYQSNDFFEKILAEHPARKLADSAENVHRVFHILEKSKSELVKLAGQFHYNLLHDNIREIDLDIILRGATEEIYTYANAAESLVQAYRHLVPDGSKFLPMYLSLKADIIGKKSVVRFFKDLRNNNSHVHILEASPHYNISTTFSGERNVSSGLRFNRTTILNGEWSQETKALAASVEHLDVIGLVTEHFKIASEFHNKVFVKTGISNDTLFRDYGRIQIARSSMSHRHSLAIILQAAIPKKLNPYEYLHMWFTSEELKNIFALPDNSKEQLEYMISLKDPLGLCDERTRLELYKLFSISK